MNLPEYFEIPELPGRKMFNCQPLRATLQVESCAERWRAGHAKGAPERLWQCRSCTLGARHAGAEEATQSPLYATSICGRCHTGATRLIGGHLCVSCYNRGREYLIGRNAKGNKPVKHPELYRIAIKYRSGGQVKTRVMAHAVDTAELVIAALRDEPKQVTFGPRIGPSRVAQGELFA